MQSPIRITNRTCPRCKGSLFLESDLGRTSYVCLMCNRSFSLTDKLLR